MDKKKLGIRLKKETSATGTGASVTPGVGAGVATKYAFKKKVKTEDAPQLAAGKVKDNYAVSHFGFTDAPSVPNRKSKAIDYKELWEAGEYESLAGILKQLGAEEDSIKVLIKAVEMGALKPSDAVTIVKKALGVKESTDDTDFDSDTTGAQGLQSSNPLPPSTLKEARYSEFKQMTKVRTPGEQLHRAIREIRRKIDEINKLVSYTEKMKTEMKEDVNEVNYLKRTKEALAKISARIQETNNKIKRLVQ